VLNYSHSFLLLTTSYYDWNIFNSQYKKRSRELSLLLLTLSYVFAIYLHYRLNVDGIA
jgi:hypothetical protein